MNSLVPSSFGELQNQANTLVKSGMLPSGITRPEQAIAIMQKGAELGIPPMQAFSHIHIIKGKPTMSAELMLSQIYKNCPKAIINYEKLDSVSCVIIATRPNHQPARFEFSIEDAKNAELLSNPNWKKYTRAMLRSRCISEMARSLFPDCIGGVSYTAEELGANVNDEGEILDVQTDQLPAPVEPVDQIYTGTGEQKIEVKRLFENYKVPKGDWQGLSEELLGMEVALPDVEKIVYERYKPEATQ